MTNRPQDMRKLMESIWASSEVSEETPDMSNLGRQDERPPKEQAIDGIWREYAKDFAGGYLTASEEDVKKMLEFAYNAGHADGWEAGGGDQGGNDTNEGCGKKHKKIKENSGGDKFKKATGILANANSVFLANNYGNDELLIGAEHIAENGERTVHGVLVRFKDLGLVDEDGEWHNVPTENE